MSVDILKYVRRFNHSKMQEILDSNYLGLETIDCVEGVLLDSMLLYEHNTEQCYLVLETYATAWTSVYSVYVDNYDIALEIWDRLFNKKVC